MQKRCHSELARFGVPGGAALAAKFLRDKDFERDLYGPGA
jgi:hypothetical protein